MFKWLGWFAGKKGKQKTPAFTEEESKVFNDLMHSYEEILYFTNLKSQPMQFNKIGFTSVYNPPQYNDDPVEYLKKLERMLTKGEGSDETQEKA